MALMFTIAGGILLAVFVLATLPWALLGLIWALYAIILMATVGGAVWLATSSLEGLAFVFVLAAFGGVCFWLWRRFREWPDLTDSETHDFLGDQQIKELHFNNLRELVEHRRRNKR
jgi:hypothetical protein